MSNEEAIRILDITTTMEALAEIEYYAGFNGIEAKRKAVDDACEMGIEALKRLIPKPVEKTKERYGTPYWCPECEADQCEVHFITADGSEPKEKISYCWRCGQAIDWSVEK